MENKTRDIFDKIIGWEIFCQFSPLYRKYKESLLYLFFGGMTFLVAIVIFAIFDKGIGINTLVANAVSWLCGVIFSFFTTRKWVFESNVKKLSTVSKQGVQFFVSRLSTLLLQEVLLFVFVGLCGFNSILIKILTESINIVLNYLVSKFIIFSK